MVKKTVKNSIIGLLLGVGSLGWGATNLMVSSIHWERLTSEERAFENASRRIYKTHWLIPQGHERNRWNFESDRAAGNFSVFVNGQKIGECQAPIIRFPLSNLKAGTNELQLVCQTNYDGLTQVNPQTNPFREHRLKRSGQYKMGFSVNSVKPCERIRELASPGDIRVAWAETSVREQKVVMNVRVDATQAFQGLLRCVIYDANRREVQRFTQSYRFEPGLQRVSLEKAWPNPQLWDVGRGYLYTADVKLFSVDGREMDEYPSFRFGFREVWVDGRTVMLNGHPLHLRTEMFLALNEKTLGFFQYLGRNCYYFQPHSNWTFGQWGELPNPYFDTLRLMDENGIVGFFPGVGVSDVAELVDDALVPSYEALMEGWMDVLRQHPCIIGWGVSMNAYNPKIEGISPQYIGRRQSIPERAMGGWSGKMINIDRATAIARKLDPTRLAYGHADGNIGSFGSGNCYPNMTPLQEVEDYPAAWSKEGDMPWMAVEYDVYDGSFYKDGALMLTEYAAIYFGEKAYDQESDEFLSRVHDLGSRGGYHGHTMGEVCQYTDLYWDFMRQYHQGTHKYWRSYGMLGWVHFFGGAYGQPNGRHCRWEQMETTSATNAPTWASPQVEIQRKYMQPFMAYIGGDAVFTDKTHAFYAGETVKKHMVCVWDGAFPVDVAVAWVVKNDRGQTVAQNQTLQRVMPGTVWQAPIVFTLPSLTARENYTIKAKAKVAGTTDFAKRSLMEDIFTIEGFPRNQVTVIPTKSSAQQRIYFLDPYQKSGWVQKLLPGCEAFQIGTQLNPGDLLIIGREGLKMNQALPYTMEAVSKGARVLILEQLPTLWENFGFRLVDLCTRRVFETPYSKEVMQGLTAADLWHWRGTPTLTPEYRLLRSVSQPPKGVNRHGVASTVFEIPDAVGFEPMFQCEFDLRYSPLLRFRTGRGAVYYSSFDFTDRVGVDPAATQLARNLLVCALKETTPADQQILVNCGTLNPETEAVLKAGGVVLNVGLTDAALAQRNIRFEKRKLHQAKLDGFLQATCATRNLFRWRDAVEVNCITEPGAECEGIWYRRGNECFLQVASGAEVGKYERADYVRSTLLSVLMMDQLKSRVLTALHAAPAPENCRRLDSVYYNIPYTYVKDWYTYGPFIYDRYYYVATYGETLPGEEQAIRGDINPNPTYQVGKADAQKAKGMDEKTKGNVFDFRNMISASESGWIDLSTQFKLEGKAAYCFLLHTWNEPQACEAIYGFSFPASATIYLNGEKVFERKNAYNELLREIPLDFYRVRLKLKAGENVITVKLTTQPENLAKGRPQRFGCTRAIEGWSMKQVMTLQSSGSLYNPKGNINYAYRYHYW